MQSSFYHSDDARAMASLTKANGTATYPSTTTVPMPPPARNVSYQKTPKWSWISTIYACIGKSFFSESLVFRRDLLARVMARNGKSNLCVGFNVRANAHAYHLVPWAYSLQIENLDWEHIDGNNLQTKFFKRCDFLGTLWICRLCICTSCCVTQI